MIAKAAIKIFDKKQDKEIIMPCHRHSDIYEILYSLGYKKDKDYYVIKEGFLDEDDTFLDRHHAYLEAKYSNQLMIVSVDDRRQELFSEDLW